MSLLGKRGLTSIGDGDEDDSSSTNPKKKQRLSEDNNNHNHNEQVPLLEGLDAFPSDLTNGEIILNVGGIKYSTTIQTITGYQSMLKARFSSKFAIKPSKDGSFFIDRNGELFQYILEYFRTGQLMLPSTWTKQDIWKFYTEIKYYCIESLLNTVLLKLFDSKIMRNNKIKSEIIDNICDKLEYAENIDNKTKLMESIISWKLMYEYNVLEIVKNNNSDSEKTYAGIMNLK